MEKYGQEKRLEMELKRLINMELLIGSRGACLPLSLSYDPLL